MFDRLQIEITNYCNAACPGCARNDYGGNQKDHVPELHMSMKTWTNIVNNIHDKIVHIIFNGNFGDVSMHPKSIDFFDILSKHRPDIFVEIHTNGGARNIEYWKELAEVLQRFKNGHIVKFSIDGDKETNHIHRRKVKWENLENNFKSFIGAGGAAQWRMILFDHNAHQIEQCKQLAKDFGFREFRLNRSYAPSLKAVEYKGLPAGIITSSFTKEEIRTLCKDNNCKWGERVRPPNRSSNDNYLCPWTADAEVQIDISGIVWPCCHWHANSYNAPASNKTDYSKYKKDLDLNIKTLGEIEKHNLFHKDIPNIIKNKSDIRCNKCDAKKYITKILKN